MPPTKDELPPSPTPAQLAHSLAGFARGALRPKKPDERFLRTIVDAGLPRGEQTVTVQALPQVARSVPRGGIVEGTGLLKKIHNSMTSFVVTHPEATILVDPAYCRAAPQRVIAELPAVLGRVVTPPADTVATVDALEDAGIAADFALPTHAHWDHVCGLLDLPELPVLLNGVEREWILGPGRPPVGGVRSALTDGRSVSGYDLDGPPVSTFTSSHDLFGDASVLLVALGGHTPGSVGVLARTDRGWVLIAGDAAWHYEQVELLRQKPDFPGGFVDEDRDATFKTLHRLHLARHQLRVVPTHDHDASLHLGC